ncbi:Fe-S-containing protein [Candidatus Magnetominusculus xianensis]|uniref:Membrane protein n=1 Tax=Candidatus Magnetominusculus xianensis TaxID=1748249 RepID=A0ABR5SJ58_9BACT|nr:Fe-S-containing protein [Candidatus Magnetominusculus xianensis]KWT93570.1 putative membrane protein [Candidatus Magnetominusculus xianensis]MBF0405359.1 DUF2318 domain-containing protein [Nitrospirota bacterium]
MLALSRNIFPALLFSIAVCACSSGQLEYTRVEDHDGAIAIPLKAVNNGDVHFFTYKYSGTNINFFVRMDGKGSLHTHFDACLTCFRFRKGYVVEGVEIVCRECKRKFMLKDEKWSNQDTCIPIDIDSEITKDTLVIKKETIIKGERYFTRRTNQ